jgi:hypothetical protein
MAKTYNFPNQYNGDSFDIITFNFFTDSATNGNEIDLTGATPRMQVRKDVIGDLVKTFTIGDGLEWVDQSTGIFRTTSFIVDWGWGEYDYDLQITYSSGRVKTYLKGKIKVNQEITIA